MSASAKTAEEKKKRGLALLLCPLCKKFLRNATTINICLHTFCQDCITKRLEEDEVKSCPVCGETLPCNPEKFLRLDHGICSIIETVHAAKQKALMASEPEEAAAEADDDDNEDKTEKDELLTQC